jgi:hypothetical protein
MVAVEPVEQGIARASFEDDPYCYESLQTAPDAGVRRMAERPMKLSTGKLGVPSGEHGKDVSIESRSHHTEGVAEIHYLASIARDWQLYRPIGKESCRTDGG